MSNPAKALSYHIPGAEVDIADLISATATAKLPETRRPETVLIMAGGLGVRMMPLTRDKPKPMLTIENRPILEHVMAQMILQGFERFAFSIRHMGNQIRDYFGDGSRWGVSIEYIEEPKRLGTGGSLAYLKRDNGLPFIVANADLITDLDYRRVLDTHANGQLVTMCTRRAEFQVPYGVVDLEGGSVTKVTEKPTQSVVISAGMYAISPEVIDYIEPDEEIDMPDLIQRVIERGGRVDALAVSDRWVDVGRRDTYLRVVEGLGAPEAEL